MNITIFRHVEFEGPALIREWADLRGHNISLFDIRHEQFMPKMDNIDLLIILGGPMSVNDSNSMLWLDNELNYINEYISAGKFVLGICLGAQMIARALGSTIRITKQPEIGWFDIELTDIGKKCKYLQGLPFRMTTFHWHGEVFDLPLGTSSLISSAANPNTAFCGDNFLALQNHFEETASNIYKMLDKSGGYLPVSEFVQEDKEIRELTPKNIIDNKKYLFRILDNIEYYL